MTKEMKKNNDEKKKWLRRYIDLITEKCFYTEKLSLLDNIKAQKMTGMPVSQSEIHDRIAENIADFDEIEHQHVKIFVEAANKIKMEIYKAIEALAKPKVKVVMLYRYIDGLDWRVIADKVGNTEKQIHRLHADGLENIEIDFSVKQKEPA